MGESKTDVADPKRCLICFWEPWLSTAPSVLNAAVRLSEGGCTVDILSFEPFLLKYPPLPSLSSGINVTRFKRARNVFGEYQRIFWRSRATRWLLSVLDSVDFLRAAIVVRRRKAYDLTIGIDTVGIILAAIAKRQTAAKLVYWSLEVDVFNTPLAVLGRLAVYLERRLVKRADMVVVQDRNRAALLRQSFSFEDSCLRLIPASAMGLPRQQCRSFLQRRLNIDRKRRIVLSAGMIGDEVLSIELAQSVHNWPQGYLLVLHERAFRDANEPYLQRIAAAGGDRVALSLTPVPLDEVDKIYSSAHIGIIMYSTEHGPNFSEIAHASGKLSYFLRNGVPIIVNANPSLTAFVDKWQCGVVAKTMDDVADCILRIEADYESYSGNATKCFVECLDFRVAFDAAFDAAWLGRRSLVEKVPC